MRFGIIAEGYADVAVIKAVLKALIGIDGSDIIQLRPSEQFDETDLNEMQFSNWNLVLESCQNEDLLYTYFESFPEEALLVVQIDTAERGEAVPKPLRTKDTEWKTYSEQLFSAVKEKISQIIPNAYREKVAYAIAIEETDAWLIPLFDTSHKDTAQHATPKEHLHNLIRKMDGKRRNRYTDTIKKNLNYVNIGKELKRKSLTICRQRNRSLDLFCAEIGEKL